MEVDLPPLPDRPRYGSKWRSPGGDPHDVLFLAYNQDLSAAVVHKDLISNAVFVAPIDYFLNTFTEIVRK